MQNVLFSLGLVASAAVGALASSAAELKIEVTQAVECDRKTKSGDGIQVHYKGTFADTGKQFDSSFDRGDPLRFKLGAGRVIKGWDEGLLDMCIGEKRTLTVPPEKGYGQRQMGPIPAGSTLVFQTELMGIDGVPKPEKIVIKETSTVSESADESTETEGKVAEKIAEAVEGAAEVIGTMLSDTDDTQEHNEL